MRPNRMMERLRAGELLLGVCNTYSSSGIIEGMCAGWDFVWIDGQHGEHDQRSTLNAIVAARSVGVASLVRVAGHAPHVLGGAADQDPSALLIPMVNSRDEARAVVAAVRFPPLGQRSYGGRRAVDLNGRDYHVERELGVVLQIETPEAVDCVDQIVSVEGVDGVFFGPDDMRVRLSLAMDTPVTADERLRAAFERTAVAARNAGKFAAVPVAGPEAASVAMSLGYRMLVGGSDIGFLRAAGARLAELREIIEQSDGTASSDDVRPI